MEIGLKSLAVLSAQLATNPAWPPHDSGNGVITAAGVTQHPHVVGDLVEGKQQEAHIHAFDDWAQPRHRRTNRHASK